MERGKSTEQLDIQAVVLVGRQDFGRCALASRLPAALWPLASKPALVRLLEHLEGEGVANTVVCCGSDASALFEATSNGRPLGVRVVTEELTKGTAGCLRDAVVSEPGDLIMVFSGSMACPPAIWDLVKAHQNGGAELTMVFNPGRPGGLPYGPPAEIYLCKPDVLQHIPSDGYFDIKEGLVPSILRAGGRIHPAVLSDEVGNFHDREGYLNALSLFLGHSPDLEDSFTVYKRCDQRLASTASGISIHSAARVYGPVAIAAGACVHEEAVVVGPVIIGREAIVGPGSVVVRSALWDGARVGAGCEVRESVVDRNAMVSRGAIIAGQTVCAKSIPSNGGLTRRAAREVREDVNAFGEHIMLWLRSVSQRLPAGTTVSWRQVASVFGGVVIVLLLLWSYWPTVTYLWSVWHRGDENSAGLLVPFLALYVLWSRRRDLGRVPIQPAILSGVAVFVVAQAMRGLGIYKMYGSAVRFSLILRSP